MSYSIKVLSNEEFDKLPYSRTHEALGVTDPKTNTAYIRYSAYPELNKFLVDHEFEHLIEEHATDEGPDGERYFLGALLGGLGGLLTKALPFVGSAVSKILPSVGGLFGGAGNLVKSAGSGLMNMFTGGGSGGGLLGGVGNMIKAPFQAIGNIGNSIFSNFGGGSGSYSPQGVQPQQRQGFGGILDSFKNPSTLLGAGMLGAGLLKGTPKVPQLPQSVNNLRSQVQAGGSPLGQQAGGVISQNLMKQFNPLTAEEITAATANLDQSRMQDIKRLEDLYASARPGTDYTTDSTYKRDLNEIESNYAQNKANLIADRTRSAEQAFNQNQFANIQAALGASSEQMAQLAQLAQLDVEQIMAQLQLDYASAMNFKQVFQNLGGQLLLSGLGANSLFGFNSGS